MPALQAREPREVWVGLCPTVREGKGDCFNVPCNETVKSLYSVLSNCRGQLCATHLKSSRSAT